MATIETPQKIELFYDGKRYWFHVWRFDTEPELLAALMNDGIRDFGKNTVAYTIGYRGKGEECGRMYLLDKSVATLAEQASIMAFELGDAAGVVDFVAEWREVISSLTGKITSELYSRSKFY